MNISDRMRAWFTPSMLTPDDVLMDLLEGIAAQYDALGGDMKMGTFDELMAESDKIQAELWRRHITKTLE